MVRERELERRRGRWRFDLGLDAGLLGDELGEGIKVATGDVVDWIERVRREPFQGWVTWFWRV